MGLDLEEEEEEVQQLILGIACNLPLLHYNIHCYSIEGQDFRVQVDGRRWLGEGPGRERR